jgi:hypothetical protein
VKQILIGSLIVVSAAAWVSPCRAQDQPSQTGPQQQASMPQPPPLPPKEPDIRMPGETGWFVGVNGWFPTEQPVFDKGHQSGYTNPSRVQLLGTPKFVAGGEIGLAVGAHNTLRISGFESRAAGDFTTPQDITVLSQTYTNGTLVSTNYRLRNIKISYEYLTWPFPVANRRFRLKTLWQVQYVDMLTFFDAPLLPLVDSSGNALLDSSGLPLSYAARESKWFVSPTFGLGASEYVSRHFRLELNASGFGVPHHTDLWDADATANIRVGHVELRVGAKAFHFKTSTAQDFFVRNTMGAAFVGFRWYGD